MEQPPANTRQASPESSHLRIRRSHAYLALIPLAFVTGLAVGYLFWGRSASAPVAREAAAQETSEPRRFEVSADDDPFVGPADAPVLLIEFSDYNCPYCRKWHQETYPELMAAYPDQIRFVYRDFPVTSEESFVAAQAAQCAGEQGAYWGFHDALMSGTLKLGQDAYAQYAGDLGLDAAKIKECIDSGRFETEVQKDLQAAAEIGVNGTPTFFVNGIPLIGAQPLLQFAQVIDAELRR